MAILTMPVIVLVVLHLVARLADARTAERSKRLLVEIESAAASTRKSPPAQAEPSATSLSALTEETDRDQG